jgi:hypothetical protein
MTALAFSSHATAQALQASQAPFMSTNEKDYVTTLLRENCVADIEHWVRCYESLPNGSGLKEQIVDRLSVYHLSRRLIVAHLHGGLTTQECSVSISGSNKPTSDLDVSVMGPSVETFFERLQMFLDEQGMSMTNFCKRFDVNFYAAPCVNLRGTALSTGVRNDVVHLPVLFRDSKEASQLTLMVSVDGTEGLPLPMTQKAIDVDWTLCLRQLLPYTPPTNDEDWKSRLEQASELHRQWSNILRQWSQNRQQKLTSSVMVDDPEHEFWDLLSQVMRMSPEAYFSCSATTLVLCIQQKRGPHLSNQIQISPETYAHVLFIAVVENAIKAKQHERETRLFQKYQARVLDFARLFPETSFSNHALLSDVVSIMLTLLAPLHQTLFEPMVETVVIPYLTEGSIDHKALRRFLYKKMSSTTHYTRSQEPDAAKSPQSMDSVDGSLGEKDKGVSSRHDMSSDIQHTMSLQTPRAPPSRIGTMNPRVHQLKPLQMPKSWSAQQPNLEPSQFGKKPLQPRAGTGDQ